MPPPDRAKPPTSGFSTNALNRQSLNGPSLYNCTYQKDTKPHQVVWDQEDKFLFYLEAGKQEEIILLTGRLFE